MLYRFFPKIIPDPESGRNQNVSKKNTSSISRCVVVLDEDFSDMVEQHQDFPELLLFQNKNEVIKSGEIISSWDVEEFTQKLTSEKYEN